jgi:hypothetical protein
MMVTTVHGQFHKFAVAMNFDESRPELSTVEANIDPSSIDTGMDARDAHLRSEDFLDAATYPEVLFRSKVIKKVGDGYTIDGELTMHGQTHPVTLDAEIGGIVPDMRGGRRAGFSASTKISRKEGGSPGTVPSRAAACLSAMKSRSPWTWRSSRAKRLLLMSRPPSLEAPYTQANSGDRCREHPTGPCKSGVRRLVSRPRLR